MTENNNLKIVNKQLNYDKVSLIKPTNSNYIHIASEIDKKNTPFFIVTSSKKKKLIKQCKNWCKELNQVNGVIEISLFKATIIPPGMGEYVKENLNKIHLAKFDFVILIEVSSEKICSEIKNHSIYKIMLSEIEKVSSYSQVMTASNIKRIGNVNHKKQGVFLFNYFSAESTEQNLKVWEYTAGWFEKETDLDNSTLLFPLNESKTTYSIVNHCRWDKYIDILPDLIFKKTFKKYVLDNFYANNVGAQPILYKVIL
ncbi:hypothetical protein C7448_109114 [Tenacibaculum gallaicum]|uniref:Uncharacterized protein n=1 Tax=Tenacibaculum gallaicum TaxID=561505 RepID=A0A3E0HHC9_9FLAO|nr:hypothetical protein [Tenacibaculum gallaicum]REH45861.1 hypothetical protein C7448_109114 [Tenacibaculum gallaicum]